MSRQLTTACARGSRKRTPKSVEDLSPTRPSRQISRTTPTVRSRFTRCRERSSTVPSGRSASSHPTSACERCCSTSRRVRPEGRSPVLAEATRQLDAYFEGDPVTFDLPLDLHGTEFKRRCWRALPSIPYGQTVSYGEPAWARERGGPSGRRRKRLQPASDRPAMPSRDRRERLAHGLRRRAPCEALPPAPSPRCARAASPTPPTTSSASRRADLRRALRAPRRAAEPG
jgi:hypothetical protein